MAHDHAHDHGHHHGHDHAPPRDWSSAFAIGVLLNTVFVVVEGGYGFASGSVALLADAGHNLSDVLGLVLAWAAAALSRRVPTPRRTYGFKASTNLAALFNAMLLLVAVGAIAAEAITRLIQPEPVATGSMLWVAAIGVVINAGTAALFMSGRHGDINVRGAFLHMAADTLVTVGVIVAALLIRVTGFLWIDPVTSLVIAASILLGTWSLLRQSIDLAMHAVPAEIDPAAVRLWLSGLPGITEVHDLHVWAIGSTDTALTAHLVCDGRLDPALPAAVNRGARERFGIAHTTVQLESLEHATLCPLRPDHVV